MVRAPKPVKPPSAGDYDFYPGLFRVVRRNGGPKAWQFVKGGGARGLFVYASYKTLDAAVQAGQRLNANGRVHVERRPIASLDHTKLR